MNTLSDTSRILATDLRRAERSINEAARNTAQFLVDTLETTDVHRLSPAVLQRTVKATMEALSALVESQHHLSMRAHLAIERAGAGLGLDENDWGAGDPKPATGPSIALDADDRVSDPIRSELA